MQGLRGEVRIKPHADSPAFLCDLPALYLDERGGGRHALQGAHPKGGVLVAKLEGVDSPEAARVLLHKKLYLSRADVALPEGVFFVADLLGLEAVDADTGRRYGVIADVFATGANDVYVIRDGAGREYLFPAVEEMIARTDVAGGQIALRPIGGIFDED